MSKKDYILAKYTSIGIVGVILLFLFFWSLYYEFLPGFIIIPLVMIIGVISLISIGIFLIDILSGNVIFLFDKNDESWE